MNIVVYKAPALIQRDAIVAHLLSHGIVSQTPEFDLRRKVSDSMVDLSYEGYSIMSEGFPIYTDESDAPRATELIRQFITESEKVRFGSTEKSPALQRFYFSSVACLFLPGLMHIVALWNLRKGLQQKEKIRWPLMIFSLLIIFLSSIVLGFLLSSSTWRELLSVVTGS